MESLRNNLPIISLCLLVIGMLNLLVYYDYFEINILSYLDLTEVFQLQFRFFVVSVVYLISLVFYTLLTHNSDAPHPHEIAAYIDAEVKKRLAAPVQEPIAVVEQTNEIDTAAITKKVHDTLKKGDAPLTAIISFFAFIIIAKWWSDIRSEQSTLVYILMWIELPLFIVLLYFVYRQIKNNFLDEQFGKDSGADASRKVILVNVLLALAFAASIKARADAMEVIDSSSYYQVTARFEDTTIVTNKNYRFVGKTKNNIFFYDVEKHQAEAYSNDKLKSFIMRDLRKLQVSAVKQNSRVSPTPTTPRTKAELKPQATSGIISGGQGR